MAFTSLIVSAALREPSDELDLSSFWEAHRFGPESILHPWTEGSGSIHLPAVFYSTEALKQFQSGPLKVLETDPQFSEVATTRHRINRDDLFDRPIVILSAPRAGSTLLWETLAASSQVWTIGGEGHHVFEALPELNTRRRGYVSNRLVAEDLTDEAAGKVRSGFIPALRNATGDLLLAQPSEERPKRLRFLEKTPKNALRLPFLRALFPDARFLVLFRDPRENVSSLMEAWRLGGRRYRAFNALPDWPAGECWKAGEWRMLLPPGWQNLRGRSLVEVAAFQWLQTYSVLLEDLAELPSEQWCPVCLSDFLADPEAQVRRLCSFTGLPFDSPLQERTGTGLPRSRATLSPPDDEKWHRNEQALAPVLPPLMEMYARLQNL